MKKLTKYGSHLNSHDLIKILAILLMIIDHIGEYLLHDNPWFRLVGRGAAPLFFFLIGYDNRLHISPALITYGLILSFTGAFLSNHIWFNILLCFIIGQQLLLYFPPEKIKFWVKCVLFILLSLMSGISAIIFEYGTLGILWMYSARLVALKTADALGWLGATAIIYFLWGNITFQFYLQSSLLFSFSALIVLLWVLMGSYTVKVFAYEGIGRWAGLFLSRYSLEIYFYHLILLQVIFLYHRLNP